MKTRRRELEVFSLSFLDCICCGFGAIILLFVVSKFGQPIKIEEMRSDLALVIAKREEELFLIRGESQVLNRELEGKKEQLSQEKVSLARLQGDLSKLLGEFAASRQNATVQNTIEGKLAISTTIHYVVVLLGFLAAMAAAGIDLSRFTVLAGAFGIGLAFGLQNIVNNFVSGLILLFERPIQVGDTVQLGQVTGDVRRIGVRSSTVRTFEGAEVIVPNADLISKEVINWTLSDHNRRIEIPIGVAYGSDPAKVISILAGVASAHPDVLGEPEPVVLFTNLGESSLDFSLARFWTSRFESHLAVRSDVLCAAYAELGEAGIEIPFPQRDVHVRSVDPAARGQSAT